VPRLRYHLRVDPSRPVWQLVGRRAAARRDPEDAAARRPILIHDEPTAVLTPQESEDLMRTLRQIAPKAARRLHHTLEEVRGVADRVTVLAAAP